VENRSKLLGKRIHDARIRLSFTQQQLAEEAGFSSAQIISQIEKGEREVKAWELFNIARALRLEISQLLAVEPQELTVPILWRKYPLEDKEIIEAEFLRRCHQYGLLEKLCAHVIERQLPSKKVDFSSMNFNDADEFGKDVWEELDLGSRPACSLRFLLEDNYGVKIWYADLAEGASAACTVGSFGTAILINSSEAPWRRNFSIAHELFHLITWSSMDLKSVAEDSVLNDKIEKLANAFASSLLLPSSQLKEAFQPRIKDNKVTETDLVEVARAFDVSTEALLYRLVNLGYTKREEIESLLDSDDFRALDRSFRVGEWAKPPSLPERFVRLAFFAYKAGNLSRPRLAEYLDTNLVELTDKLQEYGLDDRIEYEAEVRTS
jgi:Zn-dependent peptidase ImmA (M78 family)/transcriptional regulator with XRE-family HTH domain